MNEWVFGPLELECYINKSIIRVLPQAAIKTHFIILLSRGSSHRDSSWEREDASETCQHFFRPCWALTGGGGAGARAAATLAQGFVPGKPRGKSEKPVHQLSDQASACSRPSSLGVKKTKNGPLFPPYKQTNGRQDQPGPLAVSQVCSHSFIHSSSCRPHTVL